jgi:hypothetical protein
MNCGFLSTNHAHVNEPREKVESADFSNWNKRQNDSEDL